jgi:hypothetical protein
MWNTVNARPNRSTVAAGASCQPRLSRKRREKWLACTS